MGAKKSSQYAMLPAGTKVSWGADTAEDAALKPLPNCTAVGKQGAVGGFVDCTTLLDTQDQAIADLPKGPEKEFGFIDNPGDADFQAFLDAATARQTVKIKIEMPNGRISTSLISLSGWEMAEIQVPANKVISILVKGKQNDIQWSMKREDLSRKAKPESVGG